MSAVQGSVAPSFFTAAFLAIMTAVPLGSSSAPPRANGGRRSAPHAQASRKKLTRMARGRATTVSRRSWSSCNQASLEAICMQMHMSHHAHVHAHVHEARRRALSPPFFVHVFPQPTSRARVGMMHMIAGLMLAQMVPPTKAVPATSTSKDMYDFWCTPARMSSILCQHHDLIAKMGAATVSGPHAAGRSTAQ